MISPRSPISRCPMGLLSISNFTASISTALLSSVSSQTNRNGSLAVGPYVVNVPANFVKQSIIIRQWPFRAIRNQLRVFSLSQPSGSNICSTEYQEVPDVGPLLSYRFDSGYTFQATFQRIG